MNFATVERTRFCALKRNGKIGMVLVHDDVNDGEGMRNVVRVSMMNQL